MPRLRAAACCTGGGDARPPAALPRARRSPRSTDAGARRPWRARRGVPRRAARRRAAARGLRLRRQGAAQLALRPARPRGRALQGDAGARARGGPRADEGEPQRGRLRARPSTSSVSKTVLRQLETFGGLLRDPENYAVTVFGTPGAAAPWGWRARGPSSVAQLHARARQAGRGDAGLLRRQSRPRCRRGPHKGLRTLAARAGSGPRAGPEHGRGPARGACHRGAVARRHRHRARAARRASPRRRACPLADMTRRPARAR